MKKLLLFCAVALSYSGLFAQETTVKKTIFSIGAELASPVGNLKNGYNFGLGVTGQLEYMVQSNVGITLNAGYINYFNRTDGGGSLGQIPVLLGARYYFIKDIYVGGQLGFSSFNKNVGTAFSYAPGIGVKISVIDLTLKYLGASKSGGSLSNVGLRVAVDF